MSDCWIVVPVIMLAQNFMVVFDIIVKEMSDVDRLSLVRAQLPSVEDSSDLISMRERGCWSSMRPTNVLVVQAFVFLTDFRIFA